MYGSRIELYRKLEEKRQSKILLYVTGTRPGLETQMHPEVVDMFVEHLDVFYSSCGRCEKISLILHSYGGVLMVGWTLINLLRMYCRKLEVIVPFKAHSAATLLTIGADNIVMTKQATLGPIDPNVNGPYNPLQSQPFIGTKHVSVEHVYGYLDLAIKYNKNIDVIKEAFAALSREVHPLALGQIAKSQVQIRMLASKLLNKSSFKRTEKEKQKIINFLCSDSGSHDYTINRDEARDLKLPIETPSKDLYEIIWEMYCDLKFEMALNTPFNPMVELGVGNGLKEVRQVRALIESVDGGSHQFVTCATIRPAQIMPDVQMPPFTYEISKEGWEYVK